MAEPTPPALHHPRASLATPDWALELTAERAGWSWTSLRILELPAGGQGTIESGEEELLILPLEGSFAADCDGERLRDRRPVRCVPGDDRLRLRGPGPPHDSCRAPAGAVLPCPAPGRCRTSPAATARPATSPWSSAGAGACSRQVNNFCLRRWLRAPTGSSPCEVLTPAGNWSSYPPHKHDEARPRRVRARGDLLLRDRRRSRGRRHGLPARLRQRRSGPSTCWPRSAAATSCSFLTAGMGRPWRCPVTTSTT